MITLKTVLKSGGEYKPEHVLRMLEMLDRYVDCPARFVCYSDIDIPDVTVRPLLHDWQGWWSKIEMFRDVEDSFYIDLDMTINGNITDMVMADSDFMALRNMTPHIGGIGSAMMKWRGDFSFLYTLMKQDENFVLENYGRDKMGTPWLGEQGWIYAVQQSEDDGFAIEHFQDKFPNRIKRFNEKGGDVKVYYGRNRPWKHG